MARMTIFRDRKDAGRQLAAALRSYAHTDRVIILVDDGIATGGTIRAVLRGMRQSHPRRLVLAVPVAPQEAVDALRAEADEVICLATPEPFYAVGGHYLDFAQTTDREVID